MEKWLIQVEDVMIQSLMKVTEEAVAAYSSTPRDKWVKEWPGQVCSFRFQSTGIIRITMINTQSFFQIILAVSGIYWTMDVSKAITEKDGLKVRINKIVMKSYYFLFLSCLL